MALKHPIVDGTRRCTVCDEVKPINEYYLNTADSGKNSVAVFRVQGLLQGTHEEAPPPSQHLPLQKPRSAVI
jgi:hypothetical protein